MILSKRLFYLSEGKIRDLLTTLAVNKELDGKTLRKN